MDITQQLWEKIYFPLFEGVIKRRATARLYRDSLSSQWKDAETIRSQQLVALNQLLSHAGTFVPFYRDHPLIPSRVSSLDELRPLPILTKQIIRDNQDLLLSTDPGQEKWWKSTGGSTGQSLKFAHSPASHEWRSAMSLRGYSWAGALPGAKQAYIWGIPTSSSQGLKKLKERLHLKADRKRLFNCFAFTPEAMMECYKTLQSWQPDVIVGYTNPTYEFARFIERRQLPPLKVNAVLCAAEKVHPTQRELISRVFQCDVFDTYGSREFMLIGSECAEHQGLHVSMENLIVEVVNDDGTPTSPGDVGRILVTDLHNYAMPFIRYEIGDLARVSDRQCDCGRELQVLDEVVGRSLDVIRTPDGHVIPGELFPHVMKDFEDIVRFQVIQESLGQIRLLVQPEGQLSREILGLIRAKLSELVGASFDIDIIVVDDIELTPSGKHRVTISRLEK